MSHLRQVNASKEQSFGRLCVFDREETDTSDIKPIEFFPARFATREQAVAKQQEYVNWDGKSDFSIFLGAVQPFQFVETENGRATIANSAYASARWELRLVEASEYTGPDSRFELVEA